MIESKYNLYLLFFTFINNFHAGIILTIFYILLKSIVYLDKIDKYYNELDQIDKITRSFCKLISNENYEKYFTLIFAFVYIFFINNLIYPVFEISISLLCIYNIYCYRQMDEWITFIMFNVGIINCFIYNYSISKIISFMLIIFHITK